MPITFSLKTKTKTKKRNPFLAFLWLRMFTTQVFKSPSPWHRCYGNSLIQHNLLYHTIRLLLKPGLLIAGSKLIKFFLQIYIVWKLREKNGSVSSNLRVAIYSGLLSIWVSGLIFESEVLNITCVLGFEIALLPRRQIYFYPQSKNNVCQATMGFLLDFRFLIPHCHHWTIQFCLKFVQENNL